MPHKAQKFRQPAMTVLYLRVTVPPLRLSSPFIQSKHTTKYFNCNFTNDWTLTRSTCSHYKQKQTKLEKQNAMVNSVAPFFAKGTSADKLSPMTV